MDENTKAYFDKLYSSDANARYEGFTGIIAITQQPVNWAYHVWDEMLIKLEDKDNHWRAIAAQLLCNLAKSDPEQKMLKDLDAIMVVTKDERFVTARHSLMSLWKVAVVNKHLQQVVTARLTARFKDCSAEKNCTLIRYDILEVFKKMYDMLNDETIKQLSFELMDTEEDAKYKKKYAGLWKRAK